MDAADDLGNREENFGVGVRKPKREAVSLARHDVDNIVNRILRRTPELVARFGNPAGHHEDCFTPIHLD